MKVDLLLQSRLRNCLQTILELNESMGIHPFGLAFADELARLREFLARLDSIALREEDVARIEDATGVFFKELGVFFDGGQVLNNNAVRLRMQ
jgi:hypothetical protein